MTLFLRLSAADLFFLLFLSAGHPVVTLPGSAPADAKPKIIAYVNETAILPCYIIPSDDLPTVEWSKEDISPNITFLYRDGCETFAEKNPLFHNRTNIPLNKVNDGDLSLIIHDVRLSDAGVYRCLTRTGRQVQVEAALELFVVAVSEPKLTFVPADDGMMLQCKAECWFPEPQVVFLDDQGSEAEAKQSQRDEDPTGCFTITRNVALKVATSSVTCKVHQAQSNQTRSTRLHILGSCMSSCTNVCVITGGITFVVTAVLCVFIMLYGNAVYGYWIKNWAPCTTQDDDEKEEDGHLREEIANLNSALSDKENIIYNLNAQIRYLRSRPEPAPQCGQPPSTSISTPPSTSISTPPSTSISTPPSTSISTPPGTNEENQLPHSSTLKPAASSTSIHQESDHKSKVKDFKPLLNPAPGPKVKENRHKSATIPFTKDGAAPSSRPPPPTPEGSTFLRSFSFSGPHSSSVRPLRRHSTSNRYSVLGSLTEDSESLLK